MPDEHLGQSLIDSLHIRLFTARCINIDSTWNTADVLSTYWRFYKNRSDGAFLDLAECSFPLRAGCCTFVPAGVRFTCRAVSETEHFYIHFDIVGLQGMTVRALMPAPLELPFDAGLAEEADTVVALLNAEPDGLMVQSRLKALLYRALAAQLAALPPAVVDEAERGAAKAHPVLPALRRIEVDISAPLTNQRLAADCCMSEDHFIRRFRECLGETPARYIASRRISRAAQDLLFTNATIDEIAETLGFGNRFYFTRVFTREIGASPAAYRKGFRR